MIPPNSIRVLQRTNVIYQFKKCPLGDCIPENKNIYVGLTSTIFSKRLTMNLSSISSSTTFEKTFLSNNLISENSYRQHNNIRTTEKQTKISDSWRPTH